MPEETATVIDKNAKKLKALEKKIAEKRAAIAERDAIFNRAFQLMDELTRAVEAHDPTAELNYAGVCREFLDKYRAGLPVI